jgi:hypothetical protein
MVLGAVRSLEDGPRCELSVHFKHDIKRVLDRRPWAEVEKPFGIFVQLAECPENIVFIFDVGDYVAIANRLAVPKEVSPPS